MNDNHIIYVSWDINCIRHISLSSWTIFCLFTPLTAQKIKISKTWKHLERSSFYTSVRKIMIICHAVPEIWHVTYVIVIFHLGLIFALLQPKKSKSKSKTARKIKISKKMKKTSGDVIILYMCTINYD